MWVLVKNDEVVEVIKKKQIVVDGANQYPAAIFDLWSAEDRAAVGIYPVQRAARPDGNQYEITDRTYPFNGSVGVETFAIAERPIADIQRYKIGVLKQEGLTRVQVVIPAIDTLDALGLAKEQWLSVAPAARNPTDKFQRVIDIYQVALSAIAAIKSLSTGSEVMAYNVVTDPTWPA